MTIIQLEYIIAVDKHRHFGRAAEASFVTQPTLSMQIQKLEEQLGIMIFDRTKQPIAPTDIGRSVIEQAKMVVSEAKRIKDLVAEEKGEIAGELNIGIIPTVSPYLMPLFARSFIDKYPKLKIKVYEMITDQIVKKLKDETLDLGILVTPMHDQAILEQPLFYEEFMAYLSSDSSAIKKNQLEVSDIDYENIWLLNEGHCFREQVITLCKNYNDRESRLKYESGSLEALKKMVDKHGGMTLLPQLATADLSQAELSKIRSFKEPKPVREVSIVMRRSFLKRKLVEALHQEILKCLPPNIDIQKNGEVIKWK